MATTVTITLTKKDDDDNIIDAGFTADWLRKQVPEMRWQDKSGGDHRFGEDWEVVSVETSSA